MAEYNRRDFLKSGGALALAGLAHGADLSQASEAAFEPDTAVRFAGDGMSLTPGQYSRILMDLTAEEDFERDVYGNGGIISRLEQEFARLLGKETAVFLPTGTLANHIALRRLAGSRKRVIVQADSHIYNDSGDCAQNLSGLNLLPVEGEFSAKTVSRTLESSGTGRVKTPVGAILLESPLRRGFNSTHSLARVSEMAALARDHGIGLHLDGARMFMQAAHQGFSPAEMAAPFETVYVSLYKNFNAAGGAVLAGSREVLADLLHERRMFGGSPCFAWPLAAVAMLYADEFIEKYQAAKAVADQLLENLKDDSRFSFESVPNGSNSFWLRPTIFDQTLFTENLAKRNIHLMPSRPNWNGLLLMINPTLTRMSAEKLTEEFKSAAGQ